MSIISASPITQASIFLAADSASSWLNGALSSIQNQSNLGGLLGMLQNSGGDGSISSFLGSSGKTANQFALISQSSVTNTSSLVAQIAAQNAQQAGQKQLQDSIDALSATQQMVQPTNVLDPTIFFRGWVDAGYQQQHLDKIRRDANRYDNWVEGHRHVVDNSDGKWRLSRYQEQYYDYAGRIRN